MQHNKNICKFDILSVKGLHKSKTDYKHKTKGQTYSTRIIHKNMTFTQQAVIAESFNNFL